MPDVELSSVASTLPRGEEPDGRVSPVAPPRRRGRTHAILLAGLAVVAVAALVPVWTRFITFNPAEGRLSPDDHPAYFPVLMVHLVSATTALLTCLLQVWPGLRRRHPRVHRTTGRIYVFAGVLPAGLSGFAMTVIWPFSAVTSFGMILLSVLWVSVTAYGFALRRQGRTADHRRWMLRSFALTVSPLLNEAIRPFIELRLRAQLDTRLAGSEDVLGQVASALADWMSIVLVLVAVEWWLEREWLRRSARRRPVPADADAG
jgi:uncharacterized membrane protein